MKLHHLSLAALVMVISLPAVAATPAQQRIADYQAMGAGAADPAKGEVLWHSQHGERSCSSCHGDNLAQAGRHAKTGKTIKPMAPSANPERFSNARKTEKWFLRNCKWTFDRECTVQEKADILAWLNQQ